MLLSQGQGFTADKEKILMVIANKGFQDQEYGIPRKYFEDNDFSVDVASDSKEEAEGSMGTAASPDMLISEIDLSKYRAIVVVGGPGAGVFWKMKEFHAKLNAAAKQDKVVAAICISPVTLAEAGLLRGKKATVWPSESETLVTFGAKYEFKDVVTDGNMITGAGPSAALGFAKAIVEALKKKQ